MIFHKNKLLEQQEVAASLKRHERLRSELSERASIHVDEKFAGASHTVSEDDLEYIEVGLDHARRQSIKLVRQAGILPRPVLVQAF